MIPDLRFVLGAVIATALLGITLFGLVTAVHLSHQSKVGPLEASRLLAYTPEGRHRVFGAPAPRFDSPFATIAADPDPLQQSAAPAEPAEPAPAPLQQPDEPAAPPLQTAAAAPPASLPQPADETDTVDERAVVDPPLPLDNDAPAPIAESPPAPIIESAPAPVAESPPTPAESAPAPVESAPVAPSPEPAAATAPPVETALAASAPVVEIPAEPAATPEVQQVGSIPTTTTDAAETRNEVAAVADILPVTETRKRTKAARKPAARKLAARKPATRKPAARKPAAKATQPVRRTPAPVDPFASTGYPLSTMWTGNRPGKGFWPLD